MASTSITSLLNEKGTICVEGNIGCGKTTILNFFKQHYENQNDGLNKPKIVMEPVEKWKNLEGENLLQYFYDNAKEHSLAFQTYAQLTMIKQHTSKPRLMERSIYSARYCFTENLYNLDMLTHIEYTILDKWFKHLTQAKMSNKTAAAAVSYGRFRSILDRNNNNSNINQQHHAKKRSRASMEVRHLLGSENVKIDFIIYLRCSPMKTLGRIRARGRIEEDKIAFEYVKQLHDCYENWLINERFPLPAPVIVLDTDCRQDHMELLYEKALLYVDGLKQVTKPLTFFSIDHDRGTVMSLKTGNQYN